MKNYFIFGTVMVLVLFSCKGQKEAVIDEKREQKVEKNEERRFFLEEIKGDYLVYSLYGMGEEFSSVPTFSIDTSGAISGSTGCNTFSASLNSKMNQKLIDKIATTRMACQDEESEIELMFLESLKKASDVRSEGEDELIFVLENNALIKARKIMLKNYFRITKFMGKDVSELGMGFNASNEEFRIYGSTGCNSFSTQLVQNGFNVEFSEISATEKECQGFDSALEAEFLSVLQVVNKYKVSKNTYYFFEGDKEIFSAVKE